MARAQLSYCGAEVRRHDPDRFLTALFAPAAPREDLFTLYAFNLEVAKTREVVSEAILGRIRLEWWRETIAGIYAGTPREHAVVVPLAELVARRHLTRGHFERLIDARGLDLEDGGFENLPALESYCEGTASSLVALALEALGVRGEASDAAARALGIAWALTGLLRAVPFHARRRRLYLPRELMAAAGAEADELFERRGTPALAAVVRELALRARAHLAEARRHRRALPRAALPALLPATLAEAYLGELARARYDPLALDSRSTRALNLVRVALAAGRGRY